MSPEPIPSARVSGAMQADPKVIVALDFADRITLLHFGKVIVEGTRAEVVADPQTREVYLGH